MARPKHRTKPRATYFVTAETWQRRAIFRNESHARVLEETLFAYRERGVYQLHSYVVMPDHMHAILTPGDTSTLEKVMQFIKGGSSHRIGSRFPVWQPGFTEYQIRDQEDFDSHVQYIDSNPVKKRLATAPISYPFSSAAGIHELDPWPVTSGAEALGGMQGITAGLKPRPSASKNN